MSSSFVISRFPVPHSSFLALQPRLAVLNAKQRRFVLHVLVSNLLNLNKIHSRGLAGWLDVSIDLPCQWIEEHFSSRFRVAAIDSALLTFQNYSTANNQCRTFTVSQDLLDLVLGWNPTGINHATQEPIVNLFDGKLYAVQAPQEWEHGIYSPKIIRQAVAAIEGCPFNYAALDRHLTALLAAGPQAPTTKERQRLEFAYRNDKACADRIRAGCGPTTNGMARYEPEYRTTYTGRITEVGGGAQSCARAMKASLFEDIPDLKNYDLKRAQAFILLQELEDAGLPRDWVKQYVHSPNANEERAAALGISKDAYKSCLYATIMGAPHVRHWKRKENKIFKRLLADGGDDRKWAKAAAIRVYAALAPLKSEVDAWHNHLMRGEDCRHVDPAYKKVRALKNACGQHFKLEDQRADKLARRGAAFILQGQEAAFIHRLTALGTTNGFAPVSNQHDGLVVLGAIPQSAIDEAASASGLRYASMEEKAFL